MNKSHEVNPMSNRNDGNGKSGLDYVIHFVAKLLAPIVPDNESIFVGDLIVTLIQKVNKSLFVWLAG